MDCNTSQRWMEVCRPSATAADLADVPDFAAHLAECASCRARFDAQRRGDAALARAVRNVPIPAGLKSSILNRLAPSPTVPLRRRRKPLAWAGSAAAAILLTLGIAALYLRPRSQQTTVDLNDPTVLQWAESGLDAKPGDVVPAGLSRPHLESWCLQHLGFSASVPASIAPDGRQVAAARDHLHGRLVARFQYSQPPRPSAFAAIYALPERGFKPPRKRTPPFVDSHYGEGEPVRRYALTYWYERDDGMSYLAVIRGDKTDLGRFLRPASSNLLARQLGAGIRTHPRPRVQTAAARGGWSVRRMIELVGFHKK